MAAGADTDDYAAGVVVLDESIIDLHVTGDNDLHDGDAIGGQGPSAGVRSSATAVRQSAVTLAVESSTRSPLGQGVGDHRMEGHGVAVHAPQPRTSLANVDRLSQTQGAASSA